MGAILLFVPGIVSGILLTHILWSDLRFWPLVFKAALGIGLGLGLRSLLYFVYLLWLPGRQYFLLVDLAVLVTLTALAIVRQRRLGEMDWSTSRPPALLPLQRILVLMSGLVLFVSLLSTANYLLRRRQGDWDAWMMYNRAARFMFYDQVHWRESFSEQMDPIFHPDYPLLLAGNITAGWEALGRASAAVPMLQSALFAVACLGLTAGALGAAKSVGQAALGAMILWGIPVFVNEGARQMADVPMSFFILATGALFFLHVQNRHEGLLALAGFSAGLGAWTKNEGAVLVIGATVSALLLSRGSLRRIASFVAGLFIPVVVTSYFRLFLAPAGDILTGASGGVGAKLLDLSRHILILQHMWAELRSFGSWGIAGIGLGAIPILLLYYLLFRAPVQPEVRPAFVAGLLIIGVQVLGYYAAYIVSPYDLEWHLAYSSTRIVLQVFPLLLFLTLCASRAADEVLSPLPARKAE